MPNSYLAFKHFFAGISYCLFFSLLLAVLPGCDQNNVPLNAQEYPVFLNDPANGYIQSISGNGIKVSLKYLPPPYLALRELREPNRAKARPVDSLTALYAGSLNFQLLVEPLEAETNLQQLIHRNAGSEAEVLQNINTMNYGLEEKVSLLVSGKRHYPVLLTLESNVNPDKQQVYSIVFPKTPDLVKAIETADRIAVDLKDVFFLPEDMTFTFEGDRLLHYPAPKAPQLN